MCYLFLQEAINLVDNHHNRLNSVLITTHSAVRSSSSGRIEGVQAAIHGFLLLFALSYQSALGRSVHANMMHLLHHPAVKQPRGELTLSG
jgi:hypothetical protein